MFEQKIIKITTGEGIAMERDDSMSWVLNDGGRAAAGYKGAVGDCSCRAIAIATGLPYQQVYNDLTALARNKKIIKGCRYRSTARHGVDKAVIETYLIGLGWLWIPTMRIGQGCKVHLRADELPSGRLVVSVSQHMVAVIDGVVHDTYDCSRDGTRCVYGYYMKVDADDEHKSVSEIGTETDLAE